MASGASVRARIAAPPKRRWAIVADPTRHPEPAGSGGPQETKLLTDGPLKGTVGLVPAAYVTRPAAGPGGR